eukprot:TRINITY_DN18396_c0_g1_i2.p4 TRINITY_DN18396_c0_g1~~TRINITY_DN18396_c0_g1_i2.p4  ORF type:complete len:126 (+),score=11.64 TRINITY_DN18396_c0_g1_i2:964-1341(+)
MGSQTGLSDHLQVHAGEEALNRHACMSIWEMGGNPHPSPTLGRWGEIHTLHPHLGDGGKSTPFTHTWEMGGNPHPSPTLGIPTQQVKGSNCLVTVSTLHPHQGLRVPLSDCEVSHSKHLDVLSYI